MRYLKEGELVGIFPEATISRSFEIKELKSGAVRIAAAAGVPVIPVILWGTQRLMTKDHPRDFSRGKTIGIHVGEPMQVTRGGARADRRAAPPDVRAAGHRDLGLPRRGAAAGLLVAPRVVRRLGADAGRGGPAGRRGEGATGKARRESRQGD